MRYAIIKSGGKQYRVSEGQTIEVERLTHDGKTHIFKDVLFVASEGDYSVGMPLVTGITVQATVIGDMRGEKIRVSKFKSKVRYRRSTGHRQALTQLKIDEISDGKAPKKTIEKKTEVKTEKPVVKARMVTTKAVKK